MSTFYSFFARNRWSKRGCKYFKRKISLKQNKNTEAINYFKEAVEREKKMVYNEPRDWLLNPKNYLANAYLVAGQYKNAEKAFQTRPRR